MSMSILHLNITYTWIKHPMLTTTINDKINLNEDCNMYLFHGSDMSGPHHF